MKKNLMAVAMAVVVAGVSLAAGDGMMVAGGGKLKACSVTEMAQWGATHVLELNASDLTNTNTDNTAVIWTNTVAAPFSLRFAGYVLDKPFDSATTNPGTYGITFSLGPSTATTKWLSSVQVANDATPTVYGSFGTDYAITAVGSTAVVTRCDIISSNGVTFNVVSNVTVASTVTPTTTSPLLLDQASDVVILATLTPTTTNALSSVSVGKLRCYFRIIGKSYK